MNVMTPYHSELPVRHDGFGQLLRAEWTKFRTVRGWVIGVLVAVLLIVGLGALTGANSQCSVADVTPQNPNPPIQACPAPPTGPGGEWVSDSFYFVRQPLAGNGSITVRVTSLTGLYSTHGGFGSPQRPDGGHDPGRAAVGQGRDHHQGGHPPGGRVRGDDGHRKPRRADAMGLHPRRGRPGREGVRRLAALAAADPVRRRDHRLRLRRRRALDQGRHGHAGRAAGHRAGGAVRRLARVLGELDVARRSDPRPAVPPWLPAPSTR